METPIIDTLLKQGVQFVRVVWCDNGNVIRGKAIHVGALAGLEDVGVSLSAAQQAVPVTVDGVAAGSGLGPVGEVWLRPDWSTLRTLPYAPGHARVVGDMVSQGQPWPWCGRQFLRRMVQQAAEAGYHIQASFEPEFYLLNGQTLGLIPADQTPFAATLAMDIHSEVINAIAAALIDQGLVVEQYYPESGPGQQEISVRYTDALGAADQQLVYRETVKAVARQHGWRASFVPKIFAQAAGSGCHLHLSLWQTNDQGEAQNLTGDAQGGLSAATAHFMAGVLHHLPALMALTTPSPNSYRRLQPQAWSGAYRAWGFDNREAALRVPSHPTLPSPTHWELKTLDGAANPYLALGAVMAAGLDGLRRQLPLPDPVAVDPATLSEDQRQALGIDRLPTSLEAAVQALEQNPVLAQALGSELTQTLIAVRRTEIQALATLTLEEEAALLLERY
ncbi:MAG: glutamine synthetase family protein [Spirulina sp.]